MGAFDGLKDAKRGFNSNALKEGQYVVRIDECSFFETEQNGEMWKNTLTVLAVEDGEHRVGEIVNTFFRVMAGKKTFQSNLKAFIAGVLDVPDEDIGMENTKEILGADNPMRGLVTVVTAKRRTSKDKVDEKTKEPIQYTVYSWSPCLSKEETMAALGDEVYQRFFPSES